MMKIINLNVKYDVSVFVILFVNFVFLVKYVSRATSYFLPISFILTLLLFIIIKFGNRITVPQKYQKRVIILLLSLLIVGCVFIFKKVPVESLNVDRWSVVTSFWNKFFTGDYAYLAKSVDGNPPGPMPFYYVLALPFYWLGELGWYSVLGFLMFYFVLIYSRKSTDIIALFLLLVSVSPFFLWEIVTRSTIFINGTLILFSLIFLFKSLDKGHVKKIALNGILIGLLLSTRNVFVIPYIVAFLFAWRKNKVNWSQTIKIGLIAVVVFALTFLPFIWNHFSEFLKINPFIIQSGFLMPTSLSLFCVLISFVSFWLCKEESDVYFFSGIFLFVPILIHFCYHITIVGFTETFFNSVADISYFILCLPFFLYYVIENLNGSNAKVLN